MPYLKGIAGAGKSTIINDVAGRLYEPIDVGSLSNNCERQFGISSFCDKLLFTAAEIKADFRIEQAGEGSKPSLHHTFFSLAPPRTAYRASAWHAWDPQHGVSCRPTVYGRAP